jgi:hypothetical protein
MTARERVVAFRDAMASIGAKIHVMPQRTAEAMKIAAECAAEELRHPQKVLAAVKSFEALAAKEVPSGDFARLASYVDAMKRAEVDFWDGFEGQVVEGVTIVRRFFE